MQYVICYDVSDDRRRARIAKALLDYGQRIQESVFLAYLDEELRERMKARLGHLMDPVEDCLHIFLQCGQCAKSTVQMGRATVPVDSDYYIV